MIKRCIAGTLLLPLLVPPSVFCGVGFEIEIIGCGLANRPLNKRRPTAKLKDKQRPKVRKGNRDKEVDAILERLKSNKK